MNDGQGGSRWRPAAIALVMFFVLRAVIWDRYDVPLWGNLVILCGVVLALTEFKRRSDKRRR